MTTPGRDAVTNVVKRWTNLWQGLTQAAEIQLQIRRQLEQEHKKNSKATLAAWADLLAQETWTQQQLRELDLSLSTRDRISIDLGGGVGIAVGTEMLIAGDSALRAAVGGLFSALFAYGIIVLFLERLLVIMENSSPSAVAPFLIICGALFMLIVWGVGPSAVWAGVSDAFIAVLPAAFVLMFGIWACLLTHRRVRSCVNRWARGAPDVLVAIVTGLELLVLFDHDLLATQPAASLLFPIGAWFSIRTWRIMAGSRRPGVRAGADIVLSLLLGADLVLFLVWAANLLNLSRVEITVLRGTLERVGSIVDLPWPLWVGLYVLLAGISLAFALWSKRLAAISRWSQRLHVVPSIGVSRRVLSGVHISLLVTVLIAISGSASLEATLRAPLKAKYTVALQRELESHGEQAAYEEIQRHITADTNISTSPFVQPLTDIVNKIHKIGGPPPGTSDATSTERDLARHLGQLQATTLQLVPTHSVLSVHQAVTDLAPFDPPIRNAGELADRLDRLDTQLHQVDNTTRRVHQAAELAATAVANMIQIPDLGENEISQIVKEYLSGLVENSSLKEVFAAWIEHLTGVTTPPPANTMVVPDPKRLEQAARAALNQEKTRVQIADPSTPNQAEINTQTEPPAAAAVDLVNEARYLDQRTGPCDGCPQPRPPGEDHYKGPGDYPGEPVKPVEPDIRIPIFGW